MQYLSLFLRSLSGAAIFAAVIAWTPSASAAVYPARQALSPNTIQQFLANPTGLLGEFPNGGAQMIARVRDLAASDPMTLDALIGLLKSANPDQASAVGTALGQVALMAISTDQAFATQIQSEVAQSGNTPALVAFSAVVGGDIKLAAAGPGTGIGGGGESQTNTGSGFIGGFFGGTLNLNQGVRNTPDTFPTPNFSSGTPGSTSVSPF
jgi:hypothetical protein